MKCGSWVLESMGEVVVMMRGEVGLKMKWGVIYMSELGS